MSSTIISWIVLFAGAAILAGGYYMRCVTVEARKYERAANAFYDRIKPIIEDDEVPETALELLRFLNAHIHDATIGRRFFWRLVTRQKASLPSPAVLQGLKEMNEFFERRKELGGPFAEACAHAMVAMTYRAGFEGLLLRRLVLFDLERNLRRSTDIAVCISHPNGPALPA